MYWHCSFSCLVVVFLSGLVFFNIEEICFKKKCKFIRHKAAKPSSYVTIHCFAYVQNIVHHTHSFTYYTFLVVVVFSFDY